MSREIASQANYSRANRGWVSNQVQVTLAPSPTSSTSRPIPVLIRDHSVSRTTPVVEIRKPVYTPLVPRC